MTTQTQGQANLPGMAAPISRPRRNTGDDTVYPAGADELVCRSCFLITSAVVAVNGECPSCAPAPARRNVRLDTGAALRRSLLGLD